VPYLFSQSVSHTATLIEQIITQENVSLKPNEHKTRWGNKPHSEQRQRQYLLEGIQGIGPKRAKALLLHFGSLRNIFNATCQKLISVKGIHQALAVSIDQLVKSSWS
jgi:ERCC4-type nuclease